MKSIKDLSLEEFYVATLEKIVAEVDKHSNSKVALRQAAINCRNYAVMALMEKELRPLGKSVIDDYLNKAAKKALEDKSYGSE